MKKRFVITLLLLFAFAVNVGALSLPQYKFNMEIGDDYAVLTRDNISTETELAETLGYSNAATLQKYFEDNSLIAFAVSEDGSRRIQVKCAETDFSRGLEDLALLDDENLSEIAKDILPQDSKVKYSLVSLDDLVFYELTSATGDSGGTFVTLQYITVVGGRLYSISFYENGNSPSEALNAFATKTLSSVSIERGGKVSLTDAENLTEVIIIWVLIALSVVFVFLSAISLMREIIRRSSEEEKPTFISRRRYKK